jgi:hypothetical protein
VSRYDFGCAIEGTSDQKLVVRVVFNCPTVILMYLKSLDGFVCLLVPNRDISFIMSHCYIGIMVVKREVVADREGHGDVHMRRGCARVIGDESVVFG